ncbi:MAG: hypothetical protein R2734_00310 [Nocardioides sp.]
MPIAGTPPSLLNSAARLRLPPALPAPGQGAGDLCGTELPELTTATSSPTHLKRCHLASPETIYLKEVLPETAPDLVEKLS